MSSVVSTTLNGYIAFLLLAIKYYLQLILTEKSNTGGTARTHARVLRAVLGGLAAARAAHGGVASFLLAEFGAADQVPADHGHCACQNEEDNNSLHSGTGQIKFILFIF